MNIQHDKDALPTHLAPPIIISKPLILQVAGSSLSGTFLLHLLSFTLVHHSTETLPPRRFSMLPCCPLLSPLVVPHKFHHPVKKNLAVFSAFSSVFFFTYSSKRTFEKVLSFRTLSNLRRQTLNNPRRLNTHIHNPLNRRNQVAPIFKSPVRI